MKSESPRSAMGPTDDHPEADIRHIVGGIVRRGLRPLSAKGASPYVVCWNMSRRYRIKIVRAGMAARLLTMLANDMQVSCEQLCAWLGITWATASRRIQADELLSPGDSERLLGMARLIGQVHQVVEESGDPAGFDAAAWTAQWLAECNPALGGKTAGECMETAEGRDLVSGLIARMQSGACA